MLVGNVPYQADDNITAELSKKYPTLLYLLLKRRRTTKMKVRYYKTQKFSVINYIFSTHEDTDLSVRVTAVSTNHHLTFPLLQVLTNHDTVSL